MAKARKKTVIDRNPYKKGVQKKPPKAKVIKKPGKKGSPGVQANQRTPFLNAEDILEDADTRAGWADEIGGLQEDESNARADLPGMLNDALKGGTMAREDAGSSLAARGIFDSSIKDMAMADINAQQVLNESNAQNMVAAAQRALSEGQQRISGSGGEEQRHGTYQANKMVDNASEHNAQQPWLKDPTQGTAASRQVDRDPNRPGIQKKPPTPVRVTVNVGQGKKGRKGASPHRPSGDPFARSRGRR